MDILDIFKPNIEKLAAKKDREGLVRALEYRKDPAVRRAAVKALASLGDRAALEPLVRMLSDDDRGVRYDAVEAVQRVGGSDAVEPLQGALRDPDSDVRYAAAWALGETRDPRSVESLIRALGDDFWRVRTEAALALSAAKPAPLDQEIDMTLGVQDRLRRSRTIFGWLSRSCLFDCAMQTAGSGS